MSESGNNCFPIQKIAVAIICSNHRILVQKRDKGTHLEGLLEFPGGKVEKGETPLQASIREAKEEVGLILDPHVAWEIGQQAYDYPGHRIHLHFLLFEICNSLRPKKGNWVLAKDLYTHDFPPADQDVIGILKTLF